MTPKPERCDRCKRKACDCPDGPVRQPIPLAWRLRGVGS